MPYPKLQPIMEHYGLELDDIRWYLSVMMTERLASFQTEPQRLIEFIWSGQLADELFNLEEGFLDDLEQQWETGQSDEAKVREFFLEARASKRRRRAVPGNPGRPQLPQ